METNNKNNPPRTPEEVFDDFKARKSGIIKALTTDVRKFFSQCDPDKDNLCLYGLPDGRWEVALPSEEVPPEIPEPVLGINFSRDGMQENDWLALVAVHSDAWLISLAYFYGSRFGFERADRKRLFNWINEYPTIYDVVCGRGSYKKSANRSGSKSKSGSKRMSEGRQLKSPKDEDEIPNEEDEDGGNEDAFCGACGENTGNDDFWIGCDVCQKWFHGKCVKITPARAEHIKQYKCPSCSSNKRAR